MTVDIGYKNTKKVWQKQKIAEKVFEIRTILVISQSKKVINQTFTHIITYLQTMEMQGRVIAETPERSGTSARGEWKAKDFVIETHESFPHKMVFSVFGEDRLSRFNIQLGQEVLVFFDIDAREYNGRWFNSIRAYDVRQVDPAQYAAQGQQPMPGAFPPPPSMDAPIANAAQPAQPAAPQGGATAPFPPAQDNGGSADDLPF